MNRNTPRRRRTWTNSNVTLNVTAAGQPGAKQVDLGATLKGQLGITDLVGFTVARTHICVLIEGLDTNTSIITSNMGIGVYANNIDDIDFPDLSQYEGDWLAYECFIFKQPGTAGLLPVNDNTAFHRSDYRSMRKIPRTGLDLKLVFQHDTVATVNYHVACSILWLLP